MCYGRPNMSDRPDVESSANGATFSRRRKYRYRLWRTLGKGTGTLLWIMHNPSTADETIDDPTIRNCRGFADRWGFARIDVVDLFAWCAADRRALDIVNDPIGSETHHHTAAAIQDATEIICAWGDLATPRTRALRDQEIGWIDRSLAGRQVYCLGATISGYPYHPLRKPYNLQRKVYRIVAR